ncbi:MAG: bis(5'-nucleosyl)-tetraphosphatase (symmetrical) YqeK [Anaerolineales bacterium]|nr:bis(5'-nucleosyl)-tetraphosphatase (symmetrical) YqeK [Anaerolineales bacterium]MCB8937128.1 bis(5'-nucleosyl)-tetraphosphatase (symmetrical) YqeK [Ardenticatenaceae bacterium]
MHRQLQPYFATTELTGDLGEDVTAVLTHHNFPKISGHVRRVAQEAERLATRFGVDPAGAETAGWLHDISAVIPNEARVEMCATFSIPVLPGEADFPMILHQKLSAAVARDVFGVTDTAVLSAIGCHTTLKAGASVLDKIVFIADKIEWDQPGEPPYLAELETAVSHNLDDACRVYLNYLWQQREKLRYVHPWFLAAHAELDCSTPAAG